MSVIFNVLFNTTFKIVPYNPKWANGTGYFDQAVKYEHAYLFNGDDKVVKTRDEHGRRIVILNGKHFGNIVLFDRYRKDAGPDVIVGNCDSKVNSRASESCFKEVGNGRLDDQKLIDIIDGWALLIH
jgi:hypothetical protein